ncbi:MAG: stage II sporulation protein M [Spirochaetaceae bacterium]|jgi:uncharacterized membrane protein SpoIIM required for sporulation|nr:stage II sporulation protein M [Spirochaetaceae bacterium]
MTQGNFIRRRSVFWDDFEKTLRGSAKERRKQAASFPRKYRELTQDLNTARSHGFDPALIERLNLLVLEGNQLLYGQRDFSWKEPADFVLRVFPRVARSQWRGIGASLLLFYGIALFALILTVRFPGLIYEFVAEERLEDIEYMYDPDNSRFLTPRGVETDADMFGFYIYNNVSIAFSAFASGIILGVGSLFILSFNGAFLGLITGHIINKGYGQTFFPFVIGHSSFELTALVLSAYGGLLLGYRFFITQGLSRAASLRKAGRTAIPLIAGAALLLLLAAVIEAFWSSKNEFPPTLRYTAGIGGWFLLGAYFLFSGRRGEKDAEYESRRPAP